MTAFVFLQRFENGTQVPMPFEPVMSQLTRYGQPGQGQGDLEITLPADSIAAGCTVIGNPQEGVSCIGFERPRFDANLRQLVWECMKRFGCTAFDDALDTVYTPLEGATSLPSDWPEVCLSGIRSISSPQQIWPNQLESLQDSPPRPALRYTNPNPNGPNYQFFDYGELEKNHLYIELRIRPQACNPATLKVLRNLLLRVDLANANNPKFHVFYRYGHHESPLLLMESPRLGELKCQATVISPWIDEEPLKSPFVADRELFASSLNQAMGLTQQLYQEHQLQLDGSIASLDALDHFLDLQHEAYRNAKADQGGSFNSEEAARWAVRAGYYLGTVVRQQIGGQWGYVSCGARRLPVVRTHRGRLRHPHLQVLDHIINGPRDSVAQWFKQLAQTDASPTPRAEDTVSNIPGYCLILLGASQFSSGGGLPLQERIPRDKLDFSVPSLRHLDRYLADVRSRSSQISELELSNLVLAAGAYLGEVIRGNADDKACWLWTNYDDFVRENPEFTQKRPREWLYLAFLDSAQQTTYPLAQVALALAGSGAELTYPYAIQLLGKPADGAGPNATPDAERPAPTAAKPRARPAPTPLDRHQAQRAERAADGIVTVFGFIPVIIAWVVLFFAAKGALDDFSHLAGMLSVKPQANTLYKLWIASPYLGMGLVSLRVKRESLKGMGLLFAAVMLALFAMGAYGINIPTAMKPQELPAAFKWVPIVQWLWLCGWVYILYKPEEPKG